MVIAITVTLVVIVGSSLAHLNTIVIIKRLDFKLAAKFPHPFINILQLERYFSILKA
jgi:hypothetical protein